MRAVENLKRLFQINDCSEYLGTKIFKNFIELKELEKDLETYLNSTDEIPLDKVKYLQKTNEFLCRESYYSYFKQSFPAQNPLILGEHIELICDVLTLAERGLFKDIDTKSRIAISVPPRHLKSTSITNCYPSWFMGRASWRSTIVASYGDNLAEKAGQKNRERIQNFAGDLFGIEIKGDVAKKALWELTGGGRFKGTTMRGGATGEGCELMIIDDPVKNREEANSKTIQTRIWDEYQDTFMTRPHQNCVIILIMTRWSNNDLRGMIEENEKGLKWLKLDLMAICETEEEVQADPLGREIGQALYPQMFDVDYFQPFRANPRTWWSLYKQKPQIDTGEYFQRNYFQYFNFDENFVYLHSERGVIKYLLSSCRAFQTIDTAQKDKQENDETAILTVAVTPDNDMLILDCYHGKLQVPEQEKMIDLYWNKWDCSFQAIEDKQSGIGIIQKKKNEGRPILELKAKGDKIERATTSILYYANMKVYHLKGAEWLGYLETQLLEFPNSRHDDVVDTISYAGMVIENKNSIVSGV